MGTAFVRTLACWLLLPAIVLVGEGKAQSPSVIVSLDTVAGYPGQQQIRMPFYLDNLSDTIGGISVFFQLDRPDVCSLRTTVDFAGSPIAAWPALQTNNIDGQGYDVKVVGLHSFPPDSIAAPLYPQSGGPPLFTLLIDVFDPPPPFDEGAAIPLDPWSNFYLQLSDPAGHRIGWYMTEVLDTSCFVCLDWLPGDPPVCLHWSQSSGTECDSILVVPELRLVVDSGYFAVGEPGWVQLVDMVCGDFNGDGNLNITDLTLMVNYLFLAGGPPVDPGMIDLYNPCTSGINLSDMTRLLNYLFLAGPPLDCCPSYP